MVIAFRSVVISLGLLKVCQGYDVSPDCWLGNEEFSVDLICPHYTGDGKIFCCGDQFNRFCCTQEHYEAEKGVVDVKTEEVKISLKSQYEDVVINKRFRYEDEVVSTDLQMKVEVDPQSRYIKGIGIIDVENDLMDNWHFAFESMLLLAVLLILILLTVMIILTCKRLCVDGRPKDPEKVQLVKDHYTQVYH